MGNSMSLRVVLIAVVSIATPAGLHARWQDQSGPRLSNSATSELPKISATQEYQVVFRAARTSSNESIHRARARATKAAKPAAKTKDSKNKDKPGEGGRKSWKAFNSSLGVGWLSHANWMRCG